MTPNQNAKVAGFLYLLLIPLGVFGILHIPNHILVEGDLTATISSILANEFAYKMCVLSALFVQLIQVLLALALYKVLVHVSKSWAVVMVVSVLCAVPIAMLNEINLLAILQIIKNPEISNEWVSVFLSAHKYGVVVAQFFWGIWLLPMGVLVVKSGYIPKFIGYLLMIGFVGYFSDSVMLILNLDYAITISEYTFLGEVLLPLWLVFKGIEPVKKKAKTKVSAFLKDSESYTFFI